MLMKTSAIGRAVLTAREGCRLTAYRDSAGVWTIGTGHTGRASPPSVSEGMTITEAQNDEFLAADLVPMEAIINDIVVVPMADHEFDAMVSMCFNIGSPGFKGSTVVKRLNQGDRTGAADAFSMWEKPISLTSRREAERMQFLTPYTKAMPIPRIGERPIVAAASTTKPVSLPSVITPSPKPATGWRAWLQSLFGGKAA